MYANVTVKLYSRENVFHNSLLSQISHVLISSHSFNTQSTRVDWPNDLHAPTMCAFRPAEAQNAI